MAHADTTHWGYEGADGPANWGNLNPDFAVCEKGKNQSPINIQGALKASLPRLNVHYSATGRDIVNNGHTIQIGFGPGNTLMLDGKQFEMIQLHFHAPSETEIQGKTYPLEAHLVYADLQGHLAVMAVMYKIGKANPGLTKLWTQMPATAGSPVPLEVRIKPAELLPTSLGYYRYSGSLTTPPCSEGVRWLVLKRPATASKAQVGAFEKIMKHHTNRPVQPLNGRVVVE